MTVEEVLRQSGFRMTRLGRLNPRPSPHSTECCPQRRVRDRQRNRRGARDRRGQDQAFLQPERDITDRRDGQGIGVVSAPRLDIVHAEL